MRHIISLSLAQEQEYRPLGRRSRLLLRVWLLHSSVSLLEGEVSSAEGLEEDWRI